MNHFIYSPAASYPCPYARLLRDDGVEVHRWSSDAEQAPVDRDPPSFLRGWNHVEVGADGYLYAIVPLRCVLKLDSCSNIIWSATVPAHHDVCFSESLEMLVLTEVVRLVTFDGRSVVVLDNEITIVDQLGEVTESISLLDILRSNAATDGVLTEAVRRRDRVELRKDGGLEGLAQDDEAADAVRQMLQTGEYDGEARYGLQLLRLLPGSPCDVIHTNSLELLAYHPRDLWSPGDVLVSFRNLNMVAIINLALRQVVWHWGVHSLSGQHQPSALPNGNILLLDNGVAERRSRVLEVDPVSGTIVWQYVGDPPSSFFTELAGGCERLENGNILVSESQSATAFQVRRDGSIAWRYILDEAPTADMRTTWYRFAWVNRDLVKKVCLTT